MQMKVHLFLMLNYTRFPLDPAAGSDPGSVAVIDVEKWHFGGWPIASRRKHIFHITRSVPLMGAPRLRDGGRRLGPIAELG